MSKELGNLHQHGFYPWLMRAWLAFTRRKLRVLHAGDMPTAGPAIFVVNRPPSCVAALILATATELPVRCLMPREAVRGALPRFLAHRLGFLVYDGNPGMSEANLGEALDILAEGGILVVFAGRSTFSEAASGWAVSMAAELLWRAETRQARRRVAVHAVHLFLPDAGAPSRELLIYVDSAMDRPADRPSATSLEADREAFADTLALQFQENAFQLRGADMEYFIKDLEDLLRADLQEDWAARPEWKQDAEGFTVSRWVTNWVNEMNSADPARMVGLRKSLDDYRHLQHRCALREMQVEVANSPVQSSWRGWLVWLEMIAGLPLAFYGLLNHLAIIVVLFLARSLKRTSTREPATEWAIRSGVTLGFYALQIYLVAHWRSRAAAGYYAPTLPISGAYLWRYVELVRPQARLLLISRTIPRLNRSIKSLRQAILRNLDEALLAYEETMTAGRDTR